LSNLFNELDRVVTRAADRLRVDWSPLDDGRIDYSRDWKAI
jgi:hypothetical protein